ncbi:reverse transcriptase domain-containing protein [Tanacetum coccineum]
MDDEPMWAADHVVAPTPGSAITIPETANEFAIKGNHLTLVKGNQFDGRTKTDPHKHIHEFFRICDMFKYRDTKNKVVRLMMFPLSLTGEAKTWLDELNEGTIETWDELRTAFISRFFPPALFDRLLEEIRAFSQHENESLTDGFCTRLQFNAKKQKPGLDEDRHTYVPVKKKPNYYKNFPENMLVKVGKFTFLVDFGYSRNGRRTVKFLSYWDDHFLHMLMQLFELTTKQSILDGVGTERMIFNIDSAMKHSYSNDDTVLVLMFINEILEEDFDALSRQPPTDLELKPLPDKLEYVFLEEPSFLPVIISSQLSKEKKNKLVSVLKKHKEAFAWKTIDIPDICPSFCKHKIQLLDDKKPVVQKQRRLNQNMQEFVKKEIVKLLDTGIIYPIADSPWVSPIHFVPKKSGITVVTNKNDELVPTRTITDWRVCIDYRKLNEATVKDHFPLPFMDQMLERLA